MVNVVLNLEWVIVIKLHANLKANISSTLHTVQMQSYVWYRKIQTLLSLTMIMWRGRPYDIRRRLSDLFTLFKQQHKIHSRKYCNMVLCERSGFHQNRFRPLLDTSSGRGLGNNHCGFNAGISFISAGSLQQPVNMKCQLTLWSHKVHLANILD